MKYLPAPDKTRYVYYRIEPTEAPLIRELLALQARMFDVLREIERRKSNSVV